MNPHTIPWHFNSQHCNLNNDPYQNYRLHFKSGWFGSYFMSGCMNIWIQSNNHIKHKSEILFQQKKSPAGVLSARESCLLKGSVPQIKSIFQHLSNIEFPEYFDKPFHNFEQTSVQQNSQHVVACVGKPTWIILCQKWQTIIQLRILF